MSIFAPSIAVEKINMAHLIHGTVSAKAQALGLPIEHFIGFRLECEECVQSFRCARPNETHCAACRHLKIEPQARA